MDIPQIPFLERLKHGFPLVAVAGYGGGGGGGGNDPRLLALGFVAWVFFYKWTRNRFPPPSS